MLEMYQKIVVENYANFNGRADRREFCMFIGLYSFGYMILRAIDNNLDLIFCTVGLLRLLYILVVFVPILALTVRRMHDLGKRGWFILIPFYNLILVFSDGEKGQNQYGENPKEIQELIDLGKDLN